MDSGRVIGIVGGLGPYAGSDLLNKIMDNTLAICDQDHLPTILFSLPHVIGDRTAYILRETSVNPAHAIVKIILKHEQLGASVIGIPCITACSPEIFSKIMDELTCSGSKVRVLNAIDEVRKVICIRYSHIKTIGILCTNGTRKSGIYKNFIDPNANNCNIVLPDNLLQSQLNDAIYDHAYGIKAFINPPTEKALTTFSRILSHLKYKGANVVVLGCTELPVAYKGYSVARNVSLIDPTVILARALINAAHPNKLKPLEKCKAGFSDKAGERQYEGCYADWNYQGNCERA